MNGWISPADKPLIDLTEADNNDAHDRIEEDLEEIIDQLTILTMRLP